MFTSCPKCGASTELEVPSAVFQPVLDELGYENPATLATALGPDESVLVQCRAFVGGLAGTTRRILVIKSGEAHAIDYGEIEEIRLEMVGRFLKSPVCQLVTASSPYRPMKAKEADAAINAVQPRPNSMPLYEHARLRLLEIRDSRKCHACGAFVPISRLHELVPGRVDALMEPLGFGEADTVAAGIQQGEFVLCQVHGKRYAKGLVVTSRHVLVVVGSDLHSFEFAQLEGVEVQPDRIRLIMREQTELEQHGPLAAVKAHNMVPLNEPDVPKFEAVAAVIRERMAGQQSST
jgi:hypothetical protein